MGDIIINTSAVALVGIVMFIGAVGSFAPVIPGPALAFLAVLVYKLCLPDELSWGCVIFALVMTVIAQVLDFAMSFWGAKKFGATWRGCVGAFVGVFVGMFIPPQLLWIFIAPLVFAFAFELIGGVGLEAAGKAGIGAFVGSLLASIVKFMLVVAMAAYFFIEIAVRASQ